MLFVIKYCFVIFCFTTLAAPSYGQDSMLSVNKNLKVGDMVPEINFRNKANFPKNMERLSDLRGKLVILDFWSTGCAACIASFPKMEKLQKEFEGKLQIVLINSSETPKEIVQRTSAMKRYNPEYGLSTLPSVNGDQRWNELFFHKTEPHHVWIDGNGKVLYITHGYNATKEHIQSVLAGQSPRLEEKKDLAVALASSSDKQSLLETAQKKPIFYSGIFPFQPNFQGGIIPVSDTVNNSWRESYINCPIDMLYKQAIYHNPSKVHREPLIEAENKGKYTYPDDGNLIDNWGKENLYSYEVQVPFKLKKQIPAIMLQDLNRYFDVERGVVGQLERRVIPCYVLKGGNLALLESEYPQVEGSYTIEHGIHHWINSPFHVFLIRLSKQYENMNLPQAFINETDIDKKLNVDITLDVNDFVNIEQVRKALKAYGFELTRENRELEVIVIRDLNNPPKDKATTAAN